jgi:hypothetical protein
MFQFIKDTFAKPANKIIEQDLTFEELPDFVQKLRQLMEAGLVDNSNTLNVKIAVSETNYPEARRIMAKTTTLVGKRRHPTANVDESQELGDEIRKQRKIVNNNNVTYAFVPVEENPLESYAKLPSDNSGNKEYGSSSFLSRENHEPNIEYYNKPIKYPDLQYAPGIESYQSLNTPEVRKSNLNDSGRGLKKVLTQPNTSNVKVSDFSLYMPDQASTVQKNQKPSGMYDASDQMMTPIYKGSKSLNPSELPTFPYSNTPKTREGMPLHSERTSHFYSFKHPLTATIIEQKHQMKLEEFRLKHGIDFKIFPKVSDNYIAYSAVYIHPVDVPLVERFLESLEDSIVSNFREQELKFNREEIDIVKTTLPRLSQNLLFELDNIQPELIKGGYDAKLPKKIYKINNHFVFKIVEKELLLLTPNYIVCNIAENGLLLDNTLENVLSDDQISEISSSRSSNQSSSVITYDSKIKGSPVKFLLQVVNKDAWPSTMYTQIQKNTKSILAEVRPFSVSFFRMALILLAGYEESMIQCLIDEMKTSEDLYENMAFFKEVVLVTKDAGQTKQVLQIMEKLKNNPESILPLSSNSGKANWSYNYSVSKPNSTLSLSSSYDQFSHDSLAETLKSTPQLQFDKETSALIEKAYTQKKPLHIVLLDPKSQATNARTQTIIVDLERGFQKNLTTNEEVVIMNNKGTWSYLNTKGEEQLYPFPINSVLSDYQQLGVKKLTFYQNPLLMTDTKFQVVQNNFNIEINVPSFLSATAVYKIDFKTMKATPVLAKDVANFVTLNLQRTPLLVVDPNLQKRTSLKEGSVKEISAKEIEDYAISQNIFYVKLRGPDSDFGKVVEEISKAIKSRITTSSIQFKKAPDELLDYVKVLCNANNVSVTFVEEESLEDKLVLEGNKTTIYRLFNEIKRCLKIS